jgi:hypothetical protein
MADITTISVTLRGKVSSRVVTLHANGAPVTLNNDNTYAHTLVLPVGSSHLTASVSLTTVDQDGLSETRAVLIEREDVPLPFAAPA